jgi:hypothetical protein
LENDSNNLTANEQTQFISDINLAENKKAEPQG